MKISCSKDELILNINIVSKAVTGRTPIPILECILLTADEFGFRLMANDMEMGIETKSLNAEIEESGSVALEAKIFSEIIRKLPGEEVYINSDELSVTLIKSGKSEFKILGQPGDEFPFLPVVEKKNYCIIKSHMFKNMIRQTIFSVAVEESRPVLTGELFEVKNNILNLVAVDGFRVSVRTGNIGSSIDKDPIVIPFNDADELKNMSVVIPAKTLGDISKILPNENESEITAYFTDRHSLFVLPECIVVSRLIDGDFIKYEQAFATDSKLKISISRHEFLSSLERAALISRETKKNPVTIKIDDDKLTITSQTEMGRSYEEILINSTNQSLEISFNPKYLIDVCRVIESDEIILEMSTNLTPCIIRGNDGLDYKYLILPLRLKS